MAARKTLSTDTLRALGAAHLAVLLMDIAEGDAALKRRLRMEIAGPEQAAADVRKRLASLKRAKSYIEWNKTKALVQDLETQLGAITQKVAPTLMRHRRSAGSNLNPPCRRETCGTTSSAYRILTISRPRSGRWIMCWGLNRRKWRCISCATGPRWTMPPRWFCNRATGLTAKITRP